MKPYHTPSSSIKHNASFASSGIAGAAPASYGTLWDTTSPAIRGGEVGFADPAPLPGLSLLHPDTVHGAFTLFMPVGGKVVKLTRNRVERDGREVRVNIGKRKPIAGLSAAAGRRLKHSMLSVDASRVCKSFFVAMTVPAGEFGFDDFRVFLRRYRSRFERRWAAPAFWVKELTKAGTPHLHLVVLWIGKAPSLEVFKKWNDAAWAEVVRSSHPKHKEVACRVEAVRSWVGSCNYLAKYLGKGDGRLCDTGKMWGIINKKNLPVTVRVRELSQKNGQAIQRILRKYRQRSGRRYLVSSRSHSSVRAMGLPVEWHRLRMTETFDGVKVDSLEHLISLKRAAGFRVRCIVPKCFRRRVVALWSRDEKTGKLEKHGDEFTSDCCGWHCLDVATVSRLADLVVGREALDESVSLCGASDVQENKMRYMR